MKSLTVGLFFGFTSVLVLKYCNGENFQVFRDFRIPNIFKVINASSITACSMECSRKSNCWSFNYNGVLKKCELSKYIKTTLYLNPDAEKWIYAQKIIDCFDDPKKKHPDVLQFSSDQSTKAIPTKSEVNDFTLCGWMKMNKKASSGRATIFELSGDYGLAFFYQGSVLQLYGNGRGQGAVSIHFSMFAWNHLCVVNNHSGFFIYANGSKVFENLTGSKMRNGRSITISPGYNPLNGQVANLNMWDIAFNPMQITNVFAGCNPTRNVTIAWSDFLKLGNNKGIKKISIPWNVPTSHGPL